MKGRSDDTAWRENTADHLVVQGVRRVFSVSGESFLAALGGLDDRGIQDVGCRQEGCATMMAEPAQLNGPAGPGLAAWARADGGFGAPFEDHVDFAEVFAQAQASGTAALIELQQDPEVLTPGITLSEIRAAGKE